MLKTWYGLSIVDVKPELWSGVYSLSSVVTWDRDIWNMILILWASEWNCWTWDLKVKIRSCSGVNWSIEWWNLILTPNDEVEWEWKCEIVVEDNEWSEITWEVKYYVDTKKPSCNIEYYPMWITSWNVLWILTWCNKTWIKIVWIDVITWWEINQTWWNGTWIEFTWNGSWIITIEDENWNRWVIEVWVAEFLSL